MATKLPELDPATQRQLAAGLFNLVWSYLDRAARTAADDEVMLHAAHASRYYWSVIGTPLNAARGEWQLARVYAVLGRAEPALHHGRRCLELAEAHNVGPFDVGFAHEALARAALLAGDAAAAARHAALAAACAAAVSDAEDREWLLKNLGTLKSAANPR